jgi:carboxylesterase
MTTTPPLSLHDNPNLVNPQLEGEPFFWQGGPDGILLVHGYSATTAEVRLLAKALHARGYTVAGPLLPGHGTSPEDMNRYRWQDWYAMVEKAYLELEARCQRVVVGGESTGGVLTLRLAALHPEITAVLSYATALRLTLRRQDVIRLRLIAPFVPYLSKGPRQDDNPWQGYSVNPLKAALQLLRLQGETRRLLSDVRQPILIMQGKHDTTVAASAPQEIYDGVRSAIKELHWMEQSGHCVLIDREWERAVHITAKFLESVLV